MHDGAALPALVQAAPALIRIFGNSPSAERNAKAAEIVATIATQSTGAPNLQGAVERMATFREELIAVMAAVLDAHVTRASGQAITHEQDVLLDSYGYLVEAASEVAK